MTIKPQAVGTVAPGTGKTTVRTFEKTAEGLTGSAATATESLEQAPAPKREGYDRAIKTAEKLAHFHEANLEAVLKASQLFASGLSDLTKRVAGTVQVNIEEGMSHLRALTSAKSLKECLDLQAGFARAAIEKAMNDSGKLTETSLKLVEQVSAPISARVSAAVETFTDRA